MRQIRCGSDAGANQRAQRIVSKLKQRITSARPQNGAYGEACETQWRTIEFLSENVRLAA